MLPLLLVASTLIADCFAGEVESLGYEPKEYYFAYRNEEKNNEDQIVIMTTKNGYEFSLRIDYYKKKQKYQNIVEVYYNYYLLDTIEVPSIDKCDCTVSDIDDDISNSIIPVVPKMDTDTPPQIEVYYSFTDGDCVLCTYVSINGRGRYYEKGNPYGVIVDGEHCE